MKALLPLLFVLVCPLMMVFMMRGMHDHGAADASHGDRAPGEERMSADELRELRDSLEMQMVALNERIDSLEVPGASLGRGEPKASDEEREVFTT
jgi:hypothetical protein